MIQATFTISGSEFNADIIEKIKNLVNGNSSDFEVFIRVKSRESDVEMRQRIEKSMNDVENGANLISFTPNEYDNLVKQLSPKWKPYSFKKTLMMNLLSGQ